MIELPGKMHRPATLEDLAALNREMAALVRAGLPLEESLGHIAEDFGRNRGELAARLGQDMAAGKSLADAIAAQGDALPPVYRAVVEAGLKSGRLASALEGFAEAAARVADLRRITGQAAVYPLIVLSMAWVMFLAGAAWLLPRYQWLDMGDRLWMSSLSITPEQALAWIVAVPVVVFVIATIWWRRSASALPSGGTRAWMKWIPGAQRAERLSGQANFAEMLRLLLSCKIPLVEALPVAASASGSAKLTSSMGVLASRLSAGQALSGLSDAARDVPPLVRAALFGGVSEEGTLEGLGRAAQVYRERAASWVGHMAVATPIAFTLLAGALVVGVYALLMLQPYAATLEEVANWY